MVGVTEAVLRRQIATLPCRLYEVRLIHGDSRQAYPGVRQWTASQLCQPATVGFLRIRNREGYDVYFRPYAENHNAGYILLDLDCPGPGVLARLRSQGHAPSVVVETSPGRWQAWIRVSAEPLPAALATRIGAALLELAAAEPAPVRATPVQRPAADSLSTTGLYRDCLHRLRILDRYPGPDWSIADLWVARELLRAGTPPDGVATVLRGSPGFPRRHADPEDYLRRTLSRAAR